ncbi:MAG: hypothetical protein ACYDDB_05620 [bacterium]
MKNLIMKNIIINALVKKTLIFVFIFMSIIVIFRGKASARVNVGIMPYKIISTHSEKYSYLAGSIPLILSSDLAGRHIRIVRNSDVVSYAKKNHINFSSKNLLKLSKRFKADYLIFGRIVKIGGIFVIQSNIFNVAEHRVVYRSSIQAASTKFIIGDIDKLSGEFKKEINQRQPSNAFLFKKKTVQTATNAGPEIKSSIFIKRFAQSGSGLIKTASKKYVIQAISTGRFLPEGIEAAVATRHRVILYNLALNGEMTKLAQYKLSARSNVIYLGFYKISGNYRALVLTKAKLGMIISYMLVYRNGSFIKLTKNYDLFLRVMNLPGFGKVIVGQKPISVVPSGRYFGDVIGQNTYPIGQFGGETYLYKFNKNTDSLIRTKELPFYRDITLYGTAYGNIKGNGKNYLAALSNSGKLMIINNKGKTIYTGSKTYGGSPLQVKVPSFSGVKSSSYTGGLIYNIPAQVNKFSRNGKLEIIVLKNYQQGAYLHNLNYFTKSSIFNLVWNQIGFYPIWEIKPVAGYSAGFSIFKEGKNVYLADGIVENPGSAFTTPKSYIAIYKITP